MFRKLKRKLLSLISKNKKRDVVFVQAGDMKALYVDGALENYGTLTIPHVMAKVRWYGKFDFRNIHINPYWIERNMWPYHLKEIPEKEILK